MTSMIPPCVFPLHILYLILPEYLQSILWSHRNWTVVTSVERNWRFRLACTDLHFLMPFSCAYVTFILTNKWKNFFKIMDFYVAHTVANFWDPGSVGNPAEDVTLCPLTAKQTIHSKRLSMCESLWDHVMGEAVAVWWHGAYGNVWPPSRFCCKPKAAQENDVF